MRVDESWRSNAIESCDSRQLSSSFDRAFTGIIAWELGRRDKLTSYNRAKKHRNSNLFHESSSAVDILWNEQTVL